MRWRTSAAILVGALLIVLVLVRVVFLPRDPVAESPAAGKGEEALPSLVDPSLPPPAPSEEAARAQAAPSETPAEERPISRGPIYSLTGHVFLHDRLHPLRFAPLSWAKVNENGQSGWTEITTDDEARFKLDFAWPETGSFTFRHLSYEPLTFEVELPQPPVIELELIFTSGILVTGTVKNLEGTPLPRAEISWKRVGQRPVPAWTCSSDDEGRYQQGGFEEGKYLVTLTGVAAYTSVRSRSRCSAFKCSPTAGATCGCRGFRPVSTSWSSRERTANSRARVPSTGMARSRRASWSSGRKIDDWQSPTPASPTTGRWTSWRW